MRLGRIMLAGLAPLVGLSALTATLVAAPETRAAEQRSAASLYLLAPVLPFLVAAEARSTVAPVENPPAHAMLELDALLDAPLGRSLYLVRHTPAVDWGERRHLRKSLRC